MEPEQCQWHVPPKWIKEAESCQCQGTFHDTDWPTVVLG